MTGVRTGIVIACLFSLNNAMADDRVDVSVTGKIVASPCIFNNGNNVLNVDLGSLQASNMATPKSTSTPVPFSLLFTACPEGTSSVTATFSGTVDPVAGSDYFKNSGTAQNIAIGMLDLSSGNIKGSGSSITQSVQADRSISIPLAAVVYSASGGATPGTIRSVVMATLQYN